VGGCVRGKISSLRPCCQEELGEWRSVVLTKGQKGSIPQGKTAEGRKKAEKKERRPLVKGRKSHIFVRQKPATIHHRWGRRVKRTR